MLGINKRGDCYLRTLPVHSARAAMRNLERRRDPRSVGGSSQNYGAEPISLRWLAHKNAPIMWALLTRREKYCPGPTLRQGSSPSAHNGRVRRRTRAAKAAFTIAFQHAPERDGLI
jgi:hypothetical protein